MSYEAGESIANVYAEALYDVASDSGSIDAVEQELQSFSDALAADARLRHFLETPTIPAEQKRTVLTSALSGISKPTLNLLLLTIEHRRVNLIGPIATAYHRHSIAKSGIAEVEVSSARTLQSDEQEHLKTMLQVKLKRKIVLKEHVRPELLGGLILTHGGRSWDASVRNRLKKIVDKVEEAQTQAKLVE